MVSRGKRGREANPDEDGDPFLGVQRRLAETAATVARAAVSTRQFDSRLVRALTSLKGETRRAVAALRRRKPLAPRSERALSELERRAERVERRRDAVVAALGSGAVSGDGIGVSPRARRRAIQRLEALHETTTADLRRARTSAAELHAMVAYWTNRAEAAVREQDDTLARMALDRRHEHHGYASDFDEQATLLEAIVKNLEELLDRYRAGG